MVSNLEINWTLSTKQLTAYKILQDKTTTELFYGGAAGGGKSYLGCGWLIINCVAYPGTRWLMGRAILKSLKQSTLLSFFTLSKDWGLKKDEHYKYNSQEGVITFWNGSEIYLKDLFLYPSDPEFDNLGSTEYTGAFIDECSQVTSKAKDIVMSRLRFRLEEYGLMPKLFMASNPSKNFLYYDFYKPWKDGTIKPYRKFVQALVQDNPFIDDYYEINLRKLDNVSKQRLLYGNFEYDDDPAKMFEYDDILNLFRTPDKIDETGYLTVDVARFGKDKTSFFRWKGLHVVDVKEYPGKTTTRWTRVKIKSICSEHNIPIHNVVIDEDGVGGGVVDESPGVRGFVNNSRQLEDTSGWQPPHLNFANLKSQCYFKLADLTKQKKITIYPNIDGTIKETLIEELEQVKRKDPDKDARLAVVPKDKVKELLGRSPDLSDAMMMRMLFEVGKKKIDFFSLEM